MIWYGHGGDILKERINFIIEKLSISKSKFAERLNISQAFVSQMCSGAREPSDRTISDICREFGCNEVWLRTGEGEPFQEQTENEQIMRWAVQTVKGSEGFRKTLAWMLSQLDAEDWENLEAIYNKHLEKFKEKTE